MDSVDPRVVLYGVTCLGFFVFWLLGRKTETLEAAFNSLPAALVAMGALCASPLFFYMAWHQFGAKARLQQDNLPVCTALGHAIGAQGGRAPRGIWRFEARAEPGTILAYYETAAAGWKLEKKKNGLLLTRPGTQLAIWAERQDDEEQIVVQKKP